MLPMRLLRQPCAALRYIFSKNRFGVLDRLSINKVLRLPTLPNMVVKLLRGVVLRKLNSLILFLGWFWLSATIC